MAIHKKLTEGSIVFTFHQPHYHYYNHRNNRPKYNIHFNLLYVYNRRERSSGALVPDTMAGILEKLGIRSHAGQQGSIYAVGCRNFLYYQCESDIPYPSPQQIKEAAIALENVFKTEVQHQGKALIKNEFMKEFKEKNVPIQTIFFLC